MTSSMQIRIISKIHLKGTEQSPVDCEDDSCSVEVWVVCCELSSDLLVGFQSPGCIMSAAIQFIYLSAKKKKTILKKR